jgi:pimeloyl-ACP methyl ester carboxylesterase
MLKARYGDVGVKRSFVELPFGHVHVREAGNGPPMIALHESPRSSISLIPLIEGLRDRFRVIALDTPGYGLSDPLPIAEPTLDGYIDALSDIMTALGLRRAVLYGAHTGAAIAAQFAIRYPDRVLRLVLDAPSVFTMDEVDGVTHDYLTPMTPSWDGSHAIQMWSRAKDLTTWFPWYDRRPASRLPYDPPTAERVHRSAIGFLMAGAGFFKAYQRAIAFDTAQEIAKLRVPTTIIFRSEEMLLPHRARLSPTRFVSMAPVAASHEAWLEAVWEAASTAGVHEPAATTRQSGRQLVSLGDGFIHAVNHIGSGRLKVVLNDVTGGAHAWDGRACIVIDPPGCVNSDALAGEADLLVQTGTAIMQALDKLGVSDFDLECHGITPLIGQQLLAANPKAVRSLSMVSAPAWIQGTVSPPDAPVLPWLQPVADGGHITRAWFAVRDLSLYESGLYGTVRHRTDSPLPNAAAIHERFRNIVLAPEAALLCEAIRESVAEASGLRP